MYRTHAHIQVRRKHASSYLYTLAHTLHMRALGFSWVPSKACTWDVLGMCLGCTWDVLGCTWDVLGMYLGVQSFYLDGSWSWSWTNSTRQAGRRQMTVPSREAGQKLLVRLLGGAKLLQALPPAIGKAAPLLGAQLEMGFFVPFCFTAYAALARLQVLLSVLLVLSLPACWYCSLYCLRRQCPPAGSALCTACAVIARLQVLLSVLLVQSLPAYRYCPLYCLRSARALACAM